MSADVTTSSSNPVVRAIVGGAAPMQARSMAARGLLPLAAEDMLEVLVHLRADEDAEIAGSAEETLAEQTPDTLREAVAAETVSPRVLDYLARRADAGREVHEPIVLHARTPDESIVALAAATADGSLLELISTNQQRLIRARAVIDAVLANPARTPEAERRVRETRREFFEKEFGVQQVAEEMRARGMGAAAEFVEAAESVAVAGAALSIEDAWLLAGHIEVSDADIDDSWLPSELIEELVAETDEQRAGNIERVIAEAAAEIGDAVAPERVSLIRRIMLMSVKDRIKLAMKGDREARGILIRDGNKIVSTAVVHNPRITDKEVESIAAMRTVAEDVLRTVAMNRAWARIYPVIHNLARNPRTPLPTALGLLSRLQGRDLTSLSQNRNVPDGVRRQAQRLIQTRAGH